MTWRCLVRAPYREEVPGPVSSLNRFTWKPSNRPRPLDTVLNTGDSRRERQREGHTCAPQGTCVHMPNFCSVQVTHVVTSAETHPQEENKTGAAQLLLGSVRGVCHNDVTQEATVTCKLWTAVCTLDYITPQQATLAPPSGAQNSAGKAGILTWRCHLHWTSPWHPTTQPLCTHRAWCCVSQEMAEVITDLLSQRRDYFDPLARLVWSGTWE